MMYKKQVICLANSRKFNGRCIAGVELVAGNTYRWVRPVSSRPGGEIPTSDATYAGGAPIELMDIFEVTLSSPSPKSYQSENWQIAQGVPWNRVGRVEIAAISDIVSNNSSLWINGQSSGSGENDRMTEADATAAQDSLQLIQVNNLLLKLVEVYKDHSVNLRACFEYKSTNYSLRVTDPSIEKSFGDKVKGSYDVGGAYLTISLGEPFGGLVYKLVAAVIPIGETESAWRS